MQRRNKPEVLAPAGNLRGLKTAVDYGADAVYCGGKAFGMRSAPKNLSLEDFEEGARYAHERGARVYVTFNVLPRNNEVEAMREYLGKLKDTGVDALIVSDIGVMLMAKQVAPNLELHVSTQAGVTNYQAANAFYELGARRVVLAREMDLQAVRDIRARIPDDLDIERRDVHGLLRTLPVFQLSDRPRRQPRRMRAAVPLEVFDRRRETPRPVLPDRTDRGRRVRGQFAGHVHARPHRRSA